MSTTRMDKVSRTGVSPSGVAKSLVKGLALVDHVAGAPGPIRLNDLVEASGLPRPTVLRLLEALLAEGLLRSDPGHGYTLGPRLAVWGQQYLDGLDVRRLATDLMDALAATTRETCFLGVREHRQVLYIAKADSPQAVRPAARVGSRNPLHSTSIGKVLLCYADPDAVAGYLDHPLVTRTPHTITEPGRLRADLAATRERGYAIDDVENEDGVRCVAAPVRDHTGSVIAALSVSAPAYRFTLNDLHNWAPRVVATAAELAGRLGHAGARRDT